jgi:5-formyltetrahydrofolate cyclo-ligase
MILKKGTLREEARRRRAALALSIPDFAQKISCFAGEISSEGKGAIAGYLPLGDEADPRPLMERLAGLGRALALPCIEGRGVPLRFRHWAQGDPTKINVYGVAEPTGTAALVVPGLVLVPLLAFDSRGHRLGYGGGYYDRTLEGLRGDGEVVAVGIAFAEQEIEELPRTTHDHPLDLIVTEHGVRKFE